MKITALYTYPIKSLAGISLPAIQVEQRGLAYDRRWMLVDRDGLFISQRELPQMALLLPEFAGPKLIIRHRHLALEPLAVPVNPLARAPEVKVQVWEDTCRALAVSPEADAWFSEVLKTNCRLVYLPDDSIRPLDPKYGQPGEHTGFSDSCPLLVIGEASLQGLNRRLEMPVPMNRFRPNIVFSGGQAYEEEAWETFHIGEFAFRGIRPCARCQVTTIDQESGKFGKEPLRTLASYRREGHKVLFGLHASWLPEGKEKAHLQIGDEIIVEKSKHMDAS